jgi:hypothetical protein
MFVFVLSLKNIVVIIEGVRRACADHDIMGEYEGNEPASYRNLKCYAIPFS